MSWFREKAPIRAKLLFAFASLIGLMFLAVMFTAILPWPFGIFVGLAIVTGAAFLAHLYRENIAIPYVSTVVRMEGLASGDLESPIQYTDYEDCVGRMTKAMFSFRDTALAERRNAEIQVAMVRQFEKHLSQLAQGDLTSNITADFPVEYVELKDNFNQALSHLRTLIQSVQESASTIRTGSAEISEASEDLARRTEANAASLEETSAAITSMDGRLKVMASAATQTVDRADGVMHVVNDGRSVADQAVRAMNRVSDSAKGIDTVIEGLDKIAFQTRVLAMNAAVEAGRAGEAGNGFAVVADLVSQLAMRAEEEARRAREQLTATQEDIVGAVGAVVSVDKALVNIFEGVEVVHRLLADMATDNVAQSSAITQITSAIGSMDQATQQNAAMVEQTSAAARNLDSEIFRLSDQASKFAVH